MQALKGKKILLAITGGIAAYKSAELCRNLKKANADVRVVMTRGAEQFITPLTLQALSGNPVHTSLLDPEAEAGMGHIELAKWPDLIVVAPATANFIARFRHGLADDLLGSILLATTAPVMIAPAMNQAMWLNPVTQNNLSELTQLLSLERLSIIGPQDGEQACGDVGPGRMSEPEDILKSIESLYQNEVSSLSTKKVVITAGPTREALDPVRYITNHSSGKMGYAIAEACHQAGAEVVLISGPVHLHCSKEISRIDVISAQDMYDATMAQVSQGCDIFIATAAVADYRAADIKNHKMKKSTDELSITLHQNPDIVASVANLPTPPFVVGFAAETNDVLTYASGKLKKKNLDMIVANDVSQPGIGFNSDENEVFILTQDTQLKLEKSSKQFIANALIQNIAKALATQKK